MTTLGGWRVALSARAQRDVSRLPNRVAIAVVEFITVTLPVDPEQLSKPLSGELSAFRSARRGDYRIIFELQEPERLILVARIGHRAHVYRPD